MAVRAGPTGVIVLSASPAAALPGEGLGAQVVGAAGAGRLVVDAAAAVGQRQQAEVAQAVGRVRAAERLPRVGGELAEAAVGQPLAAGHAGALLPVLARGGPAVV